MDRSFSLAILLLVVVTLTLVNGLKCTDGTKMSLRIHGIKNSTGHWEKYVKLDYNGQQMAADSWDIDLREHGDDTTEHYEFVATAEVRGHFNESSVSLSRYVYRGDVRNFSDAMQACQDINATLAVINSEAEAEVLRKIVARSHDPRMAPGYRFVYLGFTDLEQEGNFVTIHGLSLNASGYARWARGEPNNLRFGLPNATFVNENCGSMNFDGLLNDSACHIRLPFICEYDDPCNPTPKGPTRPTITKTSTMIKTTTPKVDKIDIDQYK